MAKGLAEELANCCAPAVQNFLTPKKLGEKESRSRTTTKRSNANATKKGTSPKRASSRARSRNRSSSRTNTKKSKPSSSNYILTPDACKRLASWKYTKGTDTVLDRIMNVWWEFAVKFLPLWMAPNLVTLLGFLGILSTTLTLLFFIPEFNSVAPQWAYFLALLGHFFYQTMDAIDGKQARRTGATSPLGQLFDHGCDAFTTITIGVLNNACMMYGATSFTVLNTVLNFNVFFLAQWEEYHSGVLKINNGWIGLTEGQLAQMLMMLSIACLGPGLWHVPVEHSVFDAFGGFLQLRHLVLFPMAAVTMLLAVQSVLRVVVGGRTLTKKADAGAKDLGLVDKLMQLVPQYLIYWFWYRWSTGDNFELFARNVFLVYLAGGLGAAYYATKVIVAQMSKSPIRYGVALFEIVVPMMLCVEVLSKRSYEDQVLGLRLFLGWIVANYGFYVFGVGMDLSKTLGIRVFKI